MGVVAAIGCCQGALSTQCSVHKYSPNLTLLTDLYNAETVNKKCLSLIRLMLEPSQYFMCFVTDHKMSESSYEVYDSIVELVRLVLLALLES